jgi:hypothetical protein
VYATLFPALTADVIASVLEQYGANRQTALDQLVMLNKVVSSQHDPASAADGPLFDGWGGGGDSTADERDDAQAPLVVVVEGRAAPEANKPSVAGDAPASCEPDLTEQEKLGYLGAEFPGAALQALQAALDGSDGQLADAMRLLHTFEREDAAAEAERQVARAAAAAGADVEHLDSLSLDLISTAVATPPAAPPAPAAPLPPHVQARVSCLAAAFPAVAEESLQVALECAGFDLDEAKTVLREQGYTEARLAGGEEFVGYVEDAPAPARSTATTSRPSNRITVDDITAGMPSRKAETLRNQIIYDVSPLSAERAAPPACLPAPRAPASLGPSPPPLPPRSCCRRSAATCSASSPPPPSSLHRPTWRRRAGSGGWRRTWRAAPTSCAPSSRSSRRGVRRASGGA